ncbi:MAG: hypothetical protein QM804_16775 [Propionicimonas sp.]
MTQVWAALDAAWRILAIGVVLGAGLPALFAFGIRAMAWGTGGEAEIHDEGTLPPAHPVGRVIGVVIFGFVVLVVLLAISYIVAHGLGYNVVFNGVLPTFVPR